MTKVVAAVRFQKLEDTPEDTSEDTMEEIYAGRNYEGQGRRTRLKDMDSKGKNVRKKRYLAPPP